MHTNFWSFVDVIVKGSLAKVGSDISTSFEDLSFIFIIEKKLDYINIKSYFLDYLST